MKIQVVLGFLIFLFTLAEACGPGRSGGRRRMLRKRHPLVQRQYIPNVSENTLGASGRPEGAIKRQDKRFRELVENWNQDIEFRDDERTGADRMMTQRCKEKLNILAISVMNQWPGVKLRVIEGYDEDNRHSVNSLHYEGRAVDIATSDRDKVKYGMLARLAVEAGFDWVHYESRSHVHCSVKSEKADTIRNNGCFDSSSLAQTPEGEVEMSQLQTNDLVLTMNSRGQLNFSPIIMWLDKDELGQELYVELKTKSGQLIRLTSAHLIYVADEPFDLTQVGSDSTQPKLANSALASRLNSSTSVLAPGTGSGDNNQNNYYFYETQNESAQATSSSGDAKQQQQLLLSNVDKQPPPNVPTNSNNADYQLLNSISSSTTKPTLSNFINIDDVAFTTYARNVIVGQYLLINSPAEAQREEEALIRRRQAEQFILMKDVDRMPSRLIFKDDNNKFNADEDEDNVDNQDNVDSRLLNDVQRVETTSTSGGQATVYFDQIVKVNYVTRRGIYAPLTREGNIVVNSIVASCYAVISDHDMAHISFAPVRWFSYLSEWLFGLKSNSPLSQRTVEAIKRQDEQQRYLTQYTIQDTQQQATIYNSTTYLESTLPTARLSYDEQTTTTEQKPLTIQREIHWYPSMLYKIAKFILPTRYLY